MRRMIVLIGIIGTLVLLPIAIVCVVFDLFRFVGSALASLVEDGISHLHPAG